jgi:hypothetical protein
MKNVGRRVYLYDEHVSIGMVEIVNLHIDRHLGWEWEREAVVCVCGHIGEDIESEYLIRKRRKI